MQYYNPSCYLSTELDGIITLWRTGGRGITSAENICFPNHPNVAVPVPFFGNIGNNKPLIFTIGSNPSDREFIDKSGSALTVPRFFNPSTVHPSYSVATIWSACNEYFLNKPYKGWFGKKVDLKSRASLTCWVHHIMTQRNINIRQSILI